MSLMDELLDNFESFGFSNNEYQLLIDSNNENDTETDIRYRRYLTDIDCWKINDYNNTQHNLEYIRHKIVLYLQGDTFYKREIDQELLYYVNLI
jgi:hypothetical protein